MFLNIHPFKQQLISLSESARVESAHCTPGIQSIAAAQEMPVLGKVQCVLHSAITFRGETLGRPHLLFFLILLSLQMQGGRNQTSDLINFCTGRFCV